MPLFQVLYDAGPNGHWVFLLVTLIMGGTTAYVTGKAVAETWRPFWQVLFYAALIGLAVRFIHFALFEERLVSVQNYMIDVACLLAAAVVGYLLARRRQMATQYGWRAST